jgi:hypothetical protein
MKNTMVPLFDILALFALALAGVLMLMAIEGCGQGGDTGISPPTPVTRVYFIAPHDGDVLKSPIRVLMGAENLAIEPENLRSEPGIGHFDLIDGACQKAGTRLFGYKNVIDFGEGMNEAQVPLTPGKHRLCLQAADGLNTALPYTDEVDVQIIPPM